MRFRNRSAVILVIALIMTLLPVPAFAIGGTDSASAGAETAAEPVKTGWKTENGVKYYYSSKGKKLTGLRTIDKKLYYFEADGRLTSRKGWQKIGEDRYYGLGNGRFANKPTKIYRLAKATRRGKFGKKKKYFQINEVKDGRVYMFRINGKLITKKGLFKYKKKEYYGLGGGKLKTGWTAVGKKAMYFKENNGEMAKNTKIGYIKIPKSGRLGEAYALGIRKLNETEWTLEQAYRNSYRIRYADRWYRRDRIEKYAVRGFRTNTGNCYVMASTFYIQAKLLGYNIHQIQGKVAHRYPHSWTVIKHKDGEWIYDPNFRNETGRNGWKIWYGKRGTWKYTDYSTMRR